MPKTRQPDASRIPDVGNPVARRRHRAVLDDEATTRDRAYWEKWFPADFITEIVPRPVPQLVLRHPGHEHDDGAAGRRSRCCSATAWCATRWDRRCTSRQGNAIPFEGAADEGYELERSQGAGQSSTIRPMGADLMRWMYCRHNPAQNINFGPGPAEELRSKFILKLWNTYAFFCNYARLDGFDPDAPPVPVERAARHRPLDPVRPAIADRRRPARRSRVTTCWPSAWRRRSSSMTS